MYLLLLLVAFIFVSVSSFSSAWFGSVDETYFRWQGNKRLVFFPPCSPVEKNVLKA